MITAISIAIIICFPSAPVVERKDKSFAFAACFSRQMSDATFLPVCEKILKEWQKKESITEEDEQDAEDIKPSPKVERKIPESKSLLQKRDRLNDDEYM